MIAAACLSLDADPALYAAHRAFFREHHFTVVIMAPCTVVAEAEEAVQPLLQYDCFPRVKTRRRACFLRERREGNGERHNQDHDFEHVSPFSADLLQHWLSYTT